MKPRERFTTMNKYLLTSAAVAAAIVVVPATASAHNRAHVVLPTGECIITGSEKSVELPDGTYLDLRPGPGDQIGTSFAATGEHSHLGVGACP